MTQKTKSQWMLTITKYAQRLIDDLDDCGLYRARQHPAEELDRPLRRAPRCALRPRRATCSTVYTTRPDTLFGATYMVIAPEHPLIEKWASHIANMDAAAAAYRADAARKSDFERTELAKEKTGVCIEGVAAINPVNGKEIPDLRFGLCAHELRHGRHHGGAGATTTRDWDFAKKFGLPIIEVVERRRR